MCDDNSVNALYVHIGKTVEALFYDAGSVTRAKVIAKLCLLLDEEPDCIRQSEIAGAVSLLIYHFAAG
ncbi:hypothetical protein TH59_07285 [Pantoea ananatis]|nr:hypothetical protein [Pantoea ananatis]